MDRLFSPFTPKVARLIGREDFDGAIEYLRAKLRGNASDVAALEMIAQCHQWAGRTQEAISTCREALRYDAVAFESHAMLARLLAQEGTHVDAAAHARSGLECFPEPLPGIPQSFVRAIQGLGRIFPFVREFDPNGALQRGETERREWFEWATRYLGWYDKAYGDTQTPVRH